MGIEEILIAPQSHWQNAFVERFHGSLRRECLDHVTIILNELHLKRLLKSYLEYYRLHRTHLSLAKDAPQPRPVEHTNFGRVYSIPQVGGTTAIIIEPLNTASTNPVGVS
jgi:putative transposase